MFVSLKLTRIISFDLDLINLIFALVSHTLHSYLILFTRISYFSLVSHTFHSYLILFTRILYFSLVSYPFYSYLIIFTHILSFSLVSPSHASQRRFGHTILEKSKICQPRHIPGQRVGEMPLKEFCKLFHKPRREGNTTVYDVNDFKSVRSVACKCSSTRRCQCYENEAARRTVPNL